MERSDFERKVALGGFFILEVVNAGNGGFEHFVPFTVWQLRPEAEKIIKLGGGFRGVHCFLVGNGFFYICPTGLNLPAIRFNIFESLVKSGAVIGAILQKLVRTPGPDVKLFNLFAQGDKNLFVCGCIRLDFAFSLDLQPFQPIGKGSRSRSARRTDSHNNRCGWNREYNGFFLSSEHDPSRFLR